jgi:hypothetical protein
VFIDASTQEWLSGINSAKMQSQRSDILYRARNRIERFLARSSNAVGHRRYDTHAANSSNLCYWLLATGYLPPSARSAGQEFPAAEAENSASLHCKRNNQC